MGGGDDKLKLEKALGSRGPMLNDPPPPLPLEALEALALQALPLSEVSCSRLALIQLGGESARWPPSESWPPTIAGSMTVQSLTPLLLLPPPKLCHPEFCLKF